MKADCFEVSDKLLESTKIGRTYCKKARLILGFKTLQEVTINGIPYKKIKGIDIDYRTRKVELGTDKETIKLRYGAFESVVVGEDIDIVIK